MPNISVTRQLVIVMLKHPRLLRLVHPVYQKLYRYLPTDYLPLMSGMVVAASDVEKQPAD
jgi:hypothetical protein